jgi:hypothetical protein
MGRVVLVLALLGTLACNGPASAAPLPRERVPATLEPWVDWVLHDQTERLCPGRFDGAGERRCAWPTRLELDLKADGAVFTQHWQVLQESWVALPGEPGRWPQDVRAGEQSLPVVERPQGVPSVRLAPGLWVVTGRFLWERVPEVLRVPPNSGTLSLRVEGRAVSFPDLEADGRLWVRTRAARPTREGMANALSLRVFRLIADDLPLRVMTRLELDVAGEVREEVLGPALLCGSIPLALDSPLPARLEPDGRLRIQVRPGQWRITLSARYPGPIEGVSLSAVDPPWPAQELWALEAHNDLRLVTPGGAQVVDPRQTDLPAEWQSLPAYRLRAGETLTLLQVRRGDPDPEPDRLSLARSLWLDFDGTGYSVQDRVVGQVTRSWRLEAGEPLGLGQVSVDGQPQLITRAPGSEGVGVELRRGGLNLVADSRIAGAGQPALGWRHDFHDVSMRLNLPPGWRLLAAWGPDSVQQSWVSGWTLLDLFLVLVIAVAVGRLWGWPWGVLALAALALAYHEPGAPRQVWLHVLGAAALLRVVPAGRLQRVIRLYRGAALLALALLTLPFALAQVRIALYPQLEMPWLALGEEGDGQAGALADEVAAAPGATEPLPAPPAQPMVQERRAGVLALSKALSLASEAEVPRYEPGARVQTGPGLPRWTWRTVDMAWNGPVRADQGLGLLLLPPAGGLLWRLLQVALLLLLAARALDFGRGLGERLRARAPVALLGVLGVALLGGAPRPALADFPSAELLEELRERLLAPPECLPACARIPWMQLELADRVLRIRLEVHGLADAAVPLPGGVAQWQAEQVLLERDGASGQQGAVTEPLAGLARDEQGVLWARLPAGRHRLLLTGPLPERDRVQLPLPLAPQRVEVRAEGWRVEGLHEDGLPDEHLQLLRIAQAPGSTPSALEPTALPPLLQVARTIRLGLDWRVETRVTRTAGQGAAAVQVPLLPGETVNSPGVRVEHGKVLVSLGAGQEEAVWESGLQRVDRLTLRAPDETAWYEVWRLDASAIWRVSMSGIPVVHHQAQGRWLPQWRPWPGEGVTLEVSRPRAVEGSTLTVDGVSLGVSPGQRATDVRLEAVLRSSQGTQHTLQLPADAELQRVTVDGRAQPVRAQGRRVTIALEPRTQVLGLEWRQPSGMGTRFVTAPVDLGSAPVNLVMDLQVPRGRWVLLAGGPGVGPAVLFWGLLVLLVPLSLALGRSGLTPLRGHHWLLLGIGLSQVEALAALLVVGWLFALALRCRAKSLDRPWRFNLLQVGLALLTLAALAVLFQAVQGGLLALPDMQVAGNGSDGARLRWFLDRAGAQLPQAWVVSLPLAVYRLLMLAWALWLAFALLGWLRWGWACYSSGGLWRALRLARPGAGGTGAAAPG